MPEADAAAKRTGEIEEPSNRLLIHPVSRALVTRFARWGVSPNAVSLVGLGFGAGAALAYARYDEWEMVLLGFALMIGWHVMDGADGQLARLTGKTSEIGRVLDGACDHGTFVLVYVSLAAASALVLGSWVWIVAVLAGVSHAVQASAYEAQRQSYDLWVHGKASGRIPSPEEVRRSQRGARGVARVLGPLHLLYARLQHCTSAAAAPLRRGLEAARQESGGVAFVREAYRETQRSGVRRWNLLCSNYRTVAIAVACLAGSPVYFFVFEAVVLNGVFVALLAMQRRNDRALLDRLAEHPVAASNGATAESRRGANEVLST
jgi:phosphatidylglycerophosphate synthase